MDEHVKQVKQSAYAITRWTKHLLEGWGVSTEFINLFNMLLQLAIVLLLIWVFQWIAKKIIIILLKQFAKVSKIELAEHLVQNKFPTYLALVAPLTWVRNSIYVVFENYPEVILIIVKLTNIFIVLIVYWLIASILNSVSKYLLTFQQYKDKPIESYFQVVRIILMIIGFGAVFTILSGKNFASFFTAMGAASAVMMLIFKDTILGFVASVQVTSNDMVRIGDWITMPKYNADGDVVQITLTTVKIKNFDNTITTVPTYAMISDSFQNWRGMQISGGRRIKRSIIIKQSSIRYIEDEELSRFKKIQNLQEYIGKRQKEIEEYNAKINADRTLRLNGRNMTNIGLFRNYVEIYLQKHPELKKDMTIMVRQLPASALGLPMEIYCFTNTTNWYEYENIMADVFDHITAAVRYFDLEIYERSSNTELNHITFDNSLEIKGKE